MRIFFAGAVLLTALSAAANPDAAAQDKPVRLEGQVVCCAECWAEADRTKVAFGTSEDLLKAVSCVEGGDPTLIAVREGDEFALYVLEAARFRPPGKNWLEFVGKRVAVTGNLRAKRGARVVRVDALEVLAPSPAEREAARAVGSEVDLALKDLFGAEQKLSSQKGRIVVLNFWATYCSPCRTEMPDLAALQNEYAALGVQVVGASADPPEDREKVLRFIRETKINFPVWTGATAADMARFGLSGALPGTVVIGRDGKIVEVISGLVKLPELKKRIDALLETAEKAAEAERPKVGREENSSAGATPSEVSSVPS